VEVGLVATRDEMNAAVSRAMWPPPDTGVAYADLLNFSLIFFRGFGGGSLRPCVLTSIYIGLNPRDEIEVT
jgi:hypothetical protein